MREKEFKEREGDGIKEKEIKRTIWNESEGVKEEIKSLNRELRSERDGWKER